MQTRTSRIFWGSNAPGVVLAKLYPHFFVRGRHALCQPSGNHPQRQGTVRSSDGRLCWGYPRMAIKEWGMNIRLIGLRPTSKPLFRIPLGQRGQVRGIVPRVSSRYTVPLTPVKHISVLNKIHYISFKEKRCSKASRLPGAPLTTSSRESRCTERELAYMMPARANSRRGICE